MHLQMIFSLYVYVTPKGKYFLSKIVILGRELPKKTNKKKAFITIMTVSNFTYSAFVSSLRKNSQIICPPAPVQCVNKHICVSHNSHCWFKILQWDLKGHRPKSQMFLNPRSRETTCFLHLTNRCEQKKCSTRVKYKASHLWFQHAKSLRRDCFTRDLKWWLDEKNVAVWCTPYRDWRWERKTELQPQRQRKKFSYMATA